MLFDGDEARGIRELIGVAASDFTACFQKEDIDTLWNNIRTQTVAAPDEIFVCIDPNGGGLSKMAIVSGYFNGNDLVVSVFFSFYFFLAWGSTWVLHDAPIQKAVHEGFDIVEIGLWDVDVGRVERVLHEDLSEGVRGDRDCFRGGGFCSP